ncbi:hypothetical protein KAJ61_05810 [Candidatus Parcubacteria bacterium]|nr:hypothetical protein [Candidatus Parcubacteria bacterium]
MSELRYRKIRFKELDRGSDQKYFDVNNSNKINTSLGLVSDYETGRLKLAEDFASFTIAGGFPMEWYRHTTCVHFDGSTEYLYHLVRVGTLVKLYRNSGYANPDLKFTFAAATYDASMIISYLGLLLAWYYGKSDWSDDDGTSFTSNAWTYDSPRGYKITENGNLYVFTKSHILKTVDGKVWTVFYTAKTNERIVSFNELDGEFYGVLRSDSSSKIYYFIKFDNDDNPVIIRELYSDVKVSLNVFDGRVFIVLYINSVISFYEWDKSELNKIIYLEYNALHSMNLIFSSVDFLIFTAHSSSDNKTILAKINRSNGLFVISELNPSANEDFVVNVLNFKGNLSIQMYDDTTPTYYILPHRNDSGEKKQATGKYYTPIIDVGRHIPAFIIIKHRPLGDDASIVVKAKSDQGASFNITCINNITNDSVYKMASLKSLLNEVDFIEFEVTLADSSDNGEIEDLEVIYIYQPTGLENSK